MKEYQKNIEALKCGEIAYRIFCDLLGFEPKPNHAFIFSDQSEKGNDFYHKTGKYHYFKNFSTGKTYNAIEAYMLKNQCEFSTAYSELVGKYLGKVQYTGPIKPPAQKLTAQTPLEPFLRPVLRSVDAFTTNELAYWNQYGITKAILKAYKVYAVDSYQKSFWNEALKQWSTYTVQPKEENGKLIFAYQIADKAYKLYFPLHADKQKRFLWIGDKPAGNVWGVEHIPKDTEVLLITEGLKDALTLNSHTNCFTQKIWAIASDNAGSNLDPTLVAELKSQYTVLLCFDADEAGKASATKHQEAHDLGSVKLSNAIETVLKLQVSKGLKDISDLFKLAYQDLEGINKITDLQDFFSGLVEEALVLPINTKDSKCLFFNTPTIPSAVYKILPKVLAKGCNLFKAEREKDVFLTAALTVLSGCFDSVSGQYDGSTVYANLFSFIVAPAASGKGSMKWARYFAMGLHRLLLAESEKARTQFAADVAEWQAQKKSNINLVEPIIPPYKLLFFPGNSSAAMFMQNFKESDGIGILFETEADTLSGALAQDWGNFSDVLRKSFHHETASQARKGNGKATQIVEVEHPKLSICLTGTPGQVKSLIPNVENGLFSRFIFYAFNVPAVWHDVSPKAGRVTLNSHFSLLENEMLQMIEKARFTDTEFDLTQKQWSKLNNVFSPLLTLTARTCPAAKGSIMRLGLMCFRIAMILTILRNLEVGSFNGYLTCEDTDFEIALTLVDVYRKHALVMVEQLLVSNTNNLQAKKLEQMSRAKEMKAQGNSLGAISKTLSIPKATVQYWLKSV